jgi:adenine-specific DNA-methyltransferase
MAQRKTAANTKSVTIDTIKHRDTRKNIPTEELRGFAQKDEEAPGVKLYPRDPSLDPQLVWKGKDEQDRADLQVPMVPIYIQENIHPQALIDDLPRSERQESPQLDLFADFNGLGDDFSKRIEFYQHDQHWSNRMILGDSLMVMTSLAEKEGLKGKVQTIYLDPPYGIKFGSNWQVSTRKRDVKDGSVTDATRQPEQVKAFRDTWKLGIHSYLAYLRDRLVVSRELLTESGSIFVQIGDENVHLVRSLMDEVFGAENWIQTITFVKTSAATSDLLAGVNDLILWYGKSAQQTKYRALYYQKIPGQEGASAYTRVELPDGSRRPMTQEERGDNTLLPSGSKILAMDTLVSQRPPGDFPVHYEGKVFLPGKGYWKTGITGFEKLKAAGRISISGNNRLGYIRYLDDFPAVAMNNVWTDTLGQNQFGGDKSYVVQTSLPVVQRCLLMTTDPGDLVLDPTCGSGTTAYVAELWGRRWITIDTSRVALALARTRLMAAKFPYYLLADSEEGVKKETELTGQTPPPYPVEHDIRKGFVYKRVPHVTLKSIANNPDIQEGMSRGEIDAAIARHADSETLYDQPYEDTKRVRVTGPFTVESLSPHRVLATADEDYDGSVSEAEAERSTDFSTMILDQLRKSGIQNGFKGERLTFDTLNPYPGKWINATGQYTETDSTVRSVAISLGPEHGTVSTNQVKEAAKEAVRGVGFDVLVVCGFAFDPYVSEEAKSYGNLNVLPAKMNPDLTMGDELLKKTGSGNLFMIFGEPDLEVTRDAEQNVVVEIRGVDVYDPTTGEVRQSSTDDIACWFIDTNYNEEAFFVRHAYFTGAQEPYERLKRALRAEIDEDAWASLYRTESRPFPAPETGKIAVKVINHYGDEAMKVYDV